MVLRWYESLVPYEENYFLKTKNFVWYTDGMNRLYGMQMVHRWYELIVPCKEKYKKNCTIRGWQQKKIDFFVVAHYLPRLVLDLASASASR